MNKQAIRELVNKIDDMLYAPIHDDERYDMQDTVAEILALLDYSDWVPVSDHLPPFGQTVVACTASEPDEMWLSYRADLGTEKDREFDQNSFFSPYSRAVTHWHPIEPFNPEKI